MVAQLLRLRLRSIANSISLGARHALSTIVVALVVVVAALVVASFVGRLRSSSLDEVSTLVVGGGSLLLVVFFVLPFAASTPGWTDPRRLAGYGATTDRASVGLALSGVIGLPALGLVILSAGYVRAWGQGPGVAAVAVLAAVLAGVTAYLLALVGSTVRAMITSRRSRDLLVGGGVVVALLLAPLVVDLVRAALPGTRDGAAPLSRALAWMPFGAAVALPGRAARGQTGSVVLGLLIALAFIAVLWLVWRSLVFVALNRALAPAVASDPGGLGWFEFTTATPVGAIAARSLTYWGRDARYRWSLVILPFLVLLVIPLGIAGMSWGWLALVPLPLMCLLLGFLPHNDVAYDSTALWMHVASNTSGFADRVGRLVPPLLIGAPLVVVGSLVSAWIHGDFVVLPAEIGVCASLLLTGLGLSSILSAALPYAAARPGGDPFQQPQSSGPAAGWSQSIMIAGALVLSFPTGWYAVRATLGGETDLGTMAMWLGIGSGAAVLIVGVAIGSLVFGRRSPELMAFAFRS